MRKSNRLNTAEDLRKILRKYAHPAKAKILQKFFKTGSGQYGEGDLFLGVTVPKIRLLIKGAGLSLSEIKKALYSPLHEVRLAGIMILTEQFRRSEPTDQRKIFNFYMTHSKRVNNWDLVDSSAHHIAGKYLENKNKSALYRFAESKNLWQRRIAVISTWHEIRSRRFSETLKISRMLLADEHDLIHKACGWMLREADKRKPGVIHGFLKKHHSRMPRTMLRYAIERFPEAERKKILAGEF